MPFINWVQTMNKDNKLTEKPKNMLTESADQESFIKFLRLSNYSKSKSIEILKKALGISYTILNYFKLSKIFPFTPFILTRAKTTPVTIIIGLFFKSK